MKEEAAEDENSILDPSELESESGFEMSWSWSRRTSTLLRPASLKDVWHRIVLAQVQSLWVVWGGRGGGKVRHVGVKDHIEAGGGSKASELHGEGGLLGELGGVKPRGTAERTASHCSGYISPKFYICFYFYYNLGFGIRFFEKWIPNFDWTWPNRGLSGACQTAWVGLVTLSQAGIGQVLPSPREQCIVHRKQHL